MYFVEFKDRNTDQKYAVLVTPYNKADIIEATEAALSVARMLREKYESHYKLNFEESWSDARKDSFRKLNAWSVRVQDNDGKTILLITDKMCF
jgi:hypothetical protein